MNILYTHGWIDSNHKNPNYFEGRLKWFNYYRNLKTELGYDLIYMSDNASPISDIEKLPKADDIIIHRFDEHLTRKSHLEYEYHWRSIYHIRTLIEKYNPDKIMLCEWDMFLLTPRIIDHIRNSTTGIEVFHCKKYNFPESNFFTIHRDAYPLFMEYTNKDWRTEYLGKEFELIFPFTIINKDFVGDRYGELNIPQTKDMDYYCQANPDTKLVYNL